MNGELCPGCGEIDRVEWTGGTPTTDAWKCRTCGMGWAVSVAQPVSGRPRYLNDLGAAAEEIGRLRWVINQMVELADAATGITDEQLRDRLKKLTDTTLRDKDE